MSISTMYGKAAGWHAVFTESWAVVVPQFILAPIDAALPGGNPLDTGDARIHTAA
jgi:hypothetical protein